jgi:hypothetical protein
LESADQNKAKKLQDPLEGNVHDGQEHGFSSASEKALF